jgi:hypothetical protein
MEGDGLQLAVAWMQTPAFPAVVLSAFLPRECRACAVASPRVAFIYENTKASFCKSGFNLTCLLFIVTSPRTTIITLQREDFSRVSHVS